MPRFFDLPPEIRVMVYKALIADPDRVPAIPVYAGLRQSCRLVRNEFDYEIMPLLRQYQRDIVTKTFEADTCVRQTVPTTFNVSRVLELSAPRLPRRLLQLRRRHYGTRNEDQWTSIILLRALSPHIYAVCIAIRLDDASKHMSFPTDGVLIGLMCTTMWESLESSRWFWREPMGSRTQLEFPYVHVRDVEVTWENKE
jgi:hypothetical protein